MHYYSATASNKAKTLSSFTCINKWFTANLFVVYVLCLINSARFFILFFEFTNEWKRKQLFTRANLTNHLKLKSLSQAEEDNLCKTTYHMLGSQLFIVAILPSLQVIFRNTISLDSEPLDLKSPALPSVHCALVRKGTYQTYKII